jgi:EmrB/QacA subfamily drug resistance transporter
MPERQRLLIIWSALLALFLGALDALVMTAAMPTIVAELGGMSLYAWVYSAYFLFRAVSLPVFGKLSDVYPARNLMLVSISLFALASAAAGASPTMGVLVGARVFQGIGAGGIFALVYVVLSDVSLPAQRGRTLSFASAVWGLSSVIGPTLGGVIVTYLSWPWIFYMNLPLGALCFAGIALFFREFRKKPGQARLDIPGITCFTTTVLAGLTLIMTGGREIPWLSGPGLALAGLTLAAGAGFVLSERRSSAPFMDFAFFQNRGFAVGTAMTFASSFTMFSLFAYAPLFLQGALGEPPMTVGYAMLFLSLGWSVGSLAMGRTLNRVGQKPAAAGGALLMTLGALCCTGFSQDSSLAWCFAVFLFIGLGMGGVTLSTLIIVQNSLGDEHLGAATSFHQFARTLGGTVGVGICGSLVFARLTRAGGIALPQGLSEGLHGSLAQIFQPTFQAAMPQDALMVLHRAVLDGVGLAFVAASATAFLCLVLSIFLPANEKSD